MGSETTRSRNRLRRAASVGSLLILAILALWWGWGRFTAEGRRLAVWRGAAIHEPAPGAAAGGEIRVLAWNVAHGRGDADPGWLQNWRGGSTAERDTRLRRIGAFLQQVDADVVVLNEVDFDAGWSGGRNQAATLARAAGYSNRVEQRSFDYRAPLVGFAFGNALLTRLPTRAARWVDLPVHSRWESMLVGAKAASVVRLETKRGPLSVVPVHLEFRSEETRLAAVRSLETIRRQEPAPVVLAGDFNSTPPGWPGSEAETVLGALLELGWRSPRAEGPPSFPSRTFPTDEPEVALDWILVEPPLRVREATVLRPAAGLSDHFPVLAVIEWSDPRGESPAHW